MYREYKVLLLEDKEWVTDAWEDGEPCLYREEDVESILLFQKMSGVESKKQLHKEHPNQHCTPAGEVLEIINGMGISTWDCTKSENTTCRYNIEEDPACDSCVHCGEPMERDNEL